MRNGLAIILSLISTIFHYYHCTLNLISGVPRYSYQSRRLLEPNEAFTDHALETVALKLFATQNMWRMRFRNIILNLVHVFVAVSEASP